MLIRSFVLDFRNSALANALATHGHNVTVASVDEDEKPPEGVHYMHFEGIYDSEDHEELLKALFGRHSEMNPLKEPFVYDSLWYEKCKGKRVKISSRIEINLNYN